MVLGKMVAIFDWEWVENPLVLALWKFANLAKAGAQEWV